MDQERAREITGEWYRQSRFDPDTEGRARTERRRSLETLLIDLIPDPEAFTVYPMTTVGLGVNVADAPTNPSPDIALVAGFGLSRIKPNLTGEGGFGGFHVTRHELSELRVSVIEHTREALGGVRERTRGWIIKPDEEPPFALTSEEALEGPNAGPPDIELVARAIARGAGWPV